MLLKNNVETLDPKLDRIPFLDPRSKAYGIGLAGEAKTKIWHLNTHLNQQQEGSCTGCAATHLLMAPPFSLDLDIKFAKGIYWEAQKIDQFPGGSYPGASPQMEGSTVVAAMKVLKNAGHIKEYRWAFKLEELISAISNVGPAVIGIDWYEGMQSTDLFGWIKPTGKIVGGHAILVKGVNIEKQRFKLHNSWGAWGLLGDCYLSFEDMQKLFYSKNPGEFAIAVK